MMYFKHQTTGEVFAYETQADRDQYGAAELTVMSQPEVEAHINPPAVPVVPTSVTRAQARAALILVGLIDRVQTLINAIQDPTQRALVQNDWDSRQTFERNHPTLLQLASGLGLTSEQLDSLFTQAAAL